MTAASNSRLAPFAKRIDMRIRKTESCWWWTGWINAEGYGEYSTPRTSGLSVSVKAHRLVYELLVGPIPEGLVLDHLCRNRACVNPDHLEPVTDRENLRRSPLVLKDACPRGHQYVEGSYYLDRGSRCCKECKRASVAASAARSGRGEARYECEHCGLSIKVPNRSKHIKQFHPDHYQPRRPSEGLTPERAARRLQLQRERRAERRAS